MFGKIGIAKKRRPQADPQSRRGRLGAIGLSTFLIAGLVAMVSPASSATADGGEYKLDFVAAAPFTYDHDTGGGAFNDRTVGVDADIVESLEGGDFKCFEIVTFLTQIRRDSTDPDGGPERLQLDFSFLADTTGQSGVALLPTEGTPYTDHYPAGSNDPQVNSGDVENGDLVGGSLTLDSGHDDDDGNAAVLSYEWEPFNTPFTKKAETHLTVDVVGIDPGDRIVLRVDVLLACDSPRPTGNLQAALVSTQVVDDPLDAVPGGEQTVPFKVRGVYPVDCGEQDFYFEPQGDCNRFGPETANGTSANLLSIQSTETSSTNGKKSTPIVGTVTDAVSANPEVSSMFAVGGLIGLVALRRRSKAMRRHLS